MSINLLDMLKSQVGGQLASNASKFLGESESNVTSALDGIFPSILGTLSDKGGTEEGARGIMDMVKDSDTGILDNIGGLFGGGASSVNGLLNSGSGMLSTLLGSKTGGLVDALARMSGLKGGSTSSLLKMAMPFIMSMIGRQVKSNGLGVSGLMGLLKGQKDHLKGALPAELGSSLGLAGFGDRVTGSARKVATGTRETVSNVADKTTNAGKRVVESTGNAGRKVATGAGNIADTTVKTGGGLMKWLFPVLLLLGALVGWKMCGGGGTGIDMVDNVTDKVADATENVAGGAADLAKKGVDAAGDAAGAVGGAVGDAAGAVGDAVGGAFGAVSDAGAKALGAVKFGAGSVGSQMMDFVKSGGKGNKVFSLKNANFASGSAALSAETTGEVDNLAQILKAYNTMKISIDGYTDSTGNAGANKTLSQQRAESVKARLVAKGIPANRVMAMGYGAANPVADNGTADGRAKNRRIEVKIVK